MKKIGRAITYLLLGFASSCAICNLIRIVSLENQVAVLESNLEVIKSEHYPPTVEQMQQYADPCFEGWR
jgi:hypothetical protein